MRWRSRQRELPAYLAADKPRELLSCAGRCWTHGVPPLIWVRGRDVSAAASRGNRGEPLALLMPCRLRQGKRTSARSQPCDRRDREIRGSSRRLTGRVAKKEQASDRRWSPGRNWLNSLVRRACIKHQRHDTT